jgi:hypothetical protein
MKRPKPLLLVLAVSTALLACNAHARCSEDGLAIFHKYRKMRTENEATIARYQGDSKRICKFGKSRGVATLKGEAAEIRRWLRRCDDTAMRMWLNTIEDAIPKYRASVEEVCKQAVGQKSRKKK